MKLIKSTICLLLLASLSGAPLASAAPAGFVTRSGNKFMLDGQEFKFVGFNLFDAAATANYKCAGWARFTDTELDGAFKYMKTNAGATVLRFWAYQSYTNGGNDWSGIDRVVNIAKANGFKIIPVLEDGPGYCTQGGTKWQNNGIWYDNAYKRSYKYGSYALSFPDYVDRVVGRYKDEPTIMAWMIMNEPDTDNRTGLFTFAQTMAQQIKTLDPNHLLTLGSQANGAAGASGSDFLHVYGLSTLDFAEGHDWAFWGSNTDPLPGSPDGVHLPDPNSAACLSTSYIPNNAKIGCSVAQALQVLNKPYLMGEVGIAATDPTSRTQRANLIDAKMNAFFSNGGNGYLYWQFNKVVDTEKFDALQTTNDPLFPVMKKYAPATSEAPPPANPKNLRYR